MLSSYLYWFIYRRRNKFLILCLIIFCILFLLYRNDNNSTLPTSKLVKRMINERKIRINRDTYSTPEPCHGCPGENGQGVQLTVEHIYFIKNSIFLIMLLFFRRRKNRKI